MAPRTTTTPTRKNTGRSTSTVPSLVNKAAAAIHIKNDISCLQRKLWNVLLSNAYSDLPNHDVLVHEIKVKTLMEEVGFDSKNIAYLKQALEDMVTTKLTWNILDEKGKAEWGVSAALASAVIAGGTCSYSYSVHLRQKLHNPEFYAPVPLGVLRRFCSGHALALYENCLRYRQIGQTPWFSLEVFRDLLGVGDTSSYDDFKVLNRAVIKPAVKEINGVSDIELELELRRERRRVVGIKFLIDQNQQEALPIESSDTFNPHLLGKLQDTFCLSEKQAKEVLVTHSEDRVIAVMTYVEDRYKSAKVQTGKIAPYFLRTIKDFDQVVAVSSIDRQRKDAEERRILAQQQEAAAKKLREEFMAYRASQAESQYASLPDEQKRNLESSFGKYLQEQNQAVFMFYKRGGMKPKAVHTEFVKFLIEQFLPPFDPAFEAYCEANRMV